MFRNILLVDDNQSFLFTLVEAFRNLDSVFNILTAENGLEAMKVLESKRVDLVMTDLKMPVMDGFQLLSLLKERYPTIPVIVMSSFLDCEVEAALKAKGASQCLDKASLNISTLKEVILTLPVAPLSFTGQREG